MAMHESHESHESMDVFEADLTWTGARFERNVRIEILADGRIGRIHRGSPVSDHLSTTRPLPGFALLPGFVNVHSHAFQRGLRGFGETFPKGAGSFWTWRQRMYSLVESMDAERLYALSKRAFDEMLAAGITTVGEFHYVHHNASNVGFDLDQIIIKAARDAGIRMVLLETYYNTGGVTQPLTGGQLRFRVNDVAEYWSQMDRLAAQLDPATQSLGAVAHSIRAARIEDAAAIHEEACRRGMVFHMHIEEQPREIEDCLSFYGKTPMALICERLNVGPTFTAIHCTHSAKADLHAFIERGGNIGICPLSEANLGDGIADLPYMLKHDAHICIGTDANSRLSFTEELRWLEYVQRLATQSRGVCVDHDGLVARKLLQIGTANGARSLGLRAGRIETGCLADLLAIDLACPELEGWTDETLLDAFLLGTGNQAIAQVWINGKPIPTFPNPT